MTSSSTVPGFTNARLWMVLGALMLAVLLASMEISIIATALPTIAGEFDAFESFAWVGTAYLVAAAIGTPLLGKLSDLYGRRLVFQTTMGMFIVGSFLCGISQSMGQLIGARAVQGFGGGRHPGPRVRHPRRHPPAPRAGPLHRLLHARLRRRGPPRPADRRVHHRPLVVAVDLLHQHPAGRRGQRRQLHRAAAAVPAPRRPPRHPRRGAAVGDDRVADDRPGAGRPGRLGASRSSSGSSPSPSSGSSRSSSSSGGRSSR